MSKVDELGQYGDEALRWAVESATEREKDALIELAMLVAAQMEGPGRVLADSKRPVWRLPGAEDDGRA
jgi:hypothetical protein